ncbi:OadG family protein [Desulfobacula sp.]|uniref:OadG family protein n=1 Tax=Desulfobacula sp. TaxID=2593537 RepID=UPI0025BF545E|nr:OadG family protein [Desulfobacula sp.]MBC2703739.1 OadG family protein [Desulfobacula sp.]
MYGLEAINANNGWAISVVGVSIVFSGLVMLSLVISQLHKVLALWENPSKIKALFKIKQPEDQSDKLQEKEIADQAIFTESQKEVVKQFGLLIRTMEDHFSLPRLLHLAQISDLKNPHSTLNNLLETKIIIPDGSGFFTWEKETFDKAIL